MKLSQMSDAEFESWLGDSLREAGEAARAEDLSWYDRVPEGFLAAGRRALRALAPAAAASAAALHASRAALLRRALLTALVVLSAASVVSAGVFYASPALREQAVSAARRGQRSPADYVIPPPWTDGELLDEGVGDGMAYKWYRRGQRQVLVEIARALPAGAGFEGEPVVVGALEGVYSEEDQALLLRDGDTYLYIGYWNGSREDVLGYAEALVRANGAG